MKPWKARSSGVDWPRITASGALWMVVYNFIWGVAWFAFMRDEWLSAVAALGQPLPWTAEVWFVWVTFTLPIGMAIMAYAASSPAPPRAAVRASAAAWVLLQSGMTVWGIHAALSARVLVMDSCVNLAAMIAASLVGAWSLRQERIVQPAVSP